MPINKRKDGWYWGGQGPFKSRKKAEEVSQAAHASGYQKLMKQGPDTAWIEDLKAGAETVREEKPSSKGTPTSMHEADREAWGFSTDELTEAAKQRAQEARTKVGEPTEETVEEMKQKAQAKTEKWRKENEKARQESLEAYGEDPSELFGLQNFLKEGDGGMGTVAVSSDPGVFTETYGARKRKIMNRKNPQTKKSEKSGPEKLDDYLNNTFKSINDETFLIELVDHVREELHQEDELRKAGEGPHGTYTPYNERPYQPSFPQETKRKGKGRSEEINHSPTTENTVPVSTGVGSLGQSNIPQETVMAEVGVDDSRNMNRKNSYNNIRRAKNRKRAPADVGAFLNPGDESGNNFQDTAVPFTAMQKMPTHGNTTANTPKQFSTQRPQETYIERKPRLDPNSDIEQEEFVGNVDSIRDEDKNRKGRSYENNKEGNNFNTNQIDTYTMNMGGHALQAFTKEMRDVGLDSLHRESDSDITEPDDNEDIPSSETKDLLQAEKSAMKKMLAWIDELS